jgi:hypothetical protein
MTTAQAAGTAKAVAAAAGVVNGPEDKIPGWDVVDWRAAEENVRRLRQRIFTASQAGDLKRVRNLQKLMLRSLWVPIMPSPHATCEYSWRRPPSRSRLRTRMLSPADVMWDFPSGGLWPRVRCGRWVL